MHASYKISSMFLSLLVGLSISACGSNASVSRPVSESPATTVAVNSSSQDPVPTAVTSFDIATPIPNTSEPAEPTAAIPTAPRDAQRANGVLFESGFGPEAELARWTVTDTATGLSGPSVWRITNGVMEPYSDAGDLPGSYGSALTIGDAAWADYQVNVSAFNRANETFGLVARASNQGFYVFQIWNDGSLTLNRYDAQTGGYTLLTQAKLEAEQVNNQWLQIRFTVRGSKLSAAINDTQYLEATDTTFAQGQAGMYAYVMGELAFDNFSVNALAEQ